MSVCHDVRYDGEFVTLIDGMGQTMSTHTALLFRGVPEVVKKAGGSHVTKLSDSESLVINPREVVQLGEVNAFYWYVKDCIMKDVGCRMFAEWKPIYVPDVPMVWQAGVEGGYRLPPKQAPEQYYVVQSIKSPIYAAKRGTTVMVPLLETLVHVNKVWSHMTLCQIACSITGIFRPDFNDKLRLMEFLFEHARPLFADLCRTENVPLHKLHQCDFNVTFEHNQPRSSYVGMIRVMKKLDNVVMIPLSLVVSKRSYGDIPWLIADPHVKEDIMKKAKFISSPFGFFENLVQYTELEGSVLFRNLCILPEVVVEEEALDESGSKVSRKVYPPGSMLGIVVYDDGTKDTVFRGELFENISTKEQMILTFLFNAYVEGQLDQVIDCSRILRTLPLYEEQLIVRKPFIDAVQKMLFSIT